MWLIFWLFHVLSCFINHPKLATGDPWGPGTLQALLLLCRGWHHHGLAHQVLGDFSNENTGGIYMVIFTWWFNVILNVVTCYLMLFIYIYIYWWLRMAKNFRDSWGLFVERLWNLHRHWIWHTEWDWLVFKKRWVPSPGCRLQIITTGLTHREPKIGKLLSN